LVPGHLVLVRACVREKPNMCHSNTRRMYDD
jgi:hypothetical protein